MTLTMEPVEEAVGIKRHLITLDEYERMIDAGIFAEIFRLELIKGELVELMPLGIAHDSIVARVNRLFTRLVGDNALVWPQGNSVGLPESNSRPQPDITLLRWRDDIYAGKRARSEDVLLVVEVSDSTLPFDGKTKAAIYAEAGIPEYWIANLQSKVIEVYKDPSAGKYQRITKAKRGEILQLPGGLGGEIAVADILG